MTETVLVAYGMNPHASVVPFGHGLINSTWKIENGKNSFILQKINTQIFKYPEFISENIHAVADFLKQHFPNYFFLTPCKTIAGKDLVFIKEEGYYRMFPFIENSHTINVTKYPSQAYEAAKKFGELTRLLAAFPVDTLKITVPDFHNISLRYRDFLHAVRSGNKERIANASELIQFLESQKNIVDEFEKMRSSTAFKRRVTHHDTKINNVLFDESEKGICVIDLDTLMPGYFISDVGDMIRTCVPSVSEEEKDIAAIHIREEIFVALAEGYLSEMHDELRSEELHSFVYAGKFMIYMQALRFLSDHLNNDVYYGSTYEGHNYYRALNQVQLLKLLLENEKRFSAIVSDIERRLRS